MKFDHMVKFDGIYYPPFTEVPIDENAKSIEPTVEESTVGEVVSQVVKEVVETPSETEKESTYTREDIEKLNYPQMKKFAKELGLKTSSKTSGEELKKLIFDKLNL